MKSMKFYVLIFACLNLFSISAVAQEITVSGVVKDENDKPVAGVNIVVKGGNYGAVTSAEGKYSIDVSKGDVTLLFMLIGYKKFQQKFQAKTGLQYMLDVNLIKESPENALRKSYGEMDELKPQ